MKIHVIDGEFLGYKQTIANYLIEGPTGLVLVETGPSTVLATVREKVAALGFSTADVRDVLVTHIHLDHAGAAGWWARQGAQIYVHEVGARHLIDPSRLMASATRIYKEDMERLWGEMLPIPAAQVTAVKDLDVLPVGGLEITAVDTPGHAYHHHCYQLGDVAFTGDVAGASVPGYTVVDAATPPPEFNLPVWLQSVDKLLGMGLERIYLTHFGEVTAVEAHLQSLKVHLEAAVAFIEARWADGMPETQITEAYHAWYRHKTAVVGIGDEVFETLTMTNAPAMTVSGVVRFLRKRAEKEA